MRAPASSGCSPTRRSSAPAAGSGSITRRPTGLLSWTGKRHFGDSVLPELIRRHSPTAVLCGHIHEAPFKNGGSWIDRIENTWLFNAGRQIGDVPARIEIDFGQQAARWISLAGLEERALQ